MMTPFQKECAYWQTLSAPELGDHWQWLQQFSSADQIVTLLNKYNSQTVINELSKLMIARTHLETLLAQANRIFMGDFDHNILSFQLPRELAHANRRLHAMIQDIREFGKNKGLWQIKEETVNGKNYTILTSDSVDIPSSCQEELPEPKTYEPTPYNEPDWRDKYLPGQAIDLVMGIDIETTGINPWRGYIIDIGFEYMHLQPDSTTPDNTTNDYQYLDPSYHADGAFNQSRHGFAVDPLTSKRGNDFILQLTGIDIHQRGEGWTMLDESYEWQDALVSRFLQQPIVAHNSDFEHKWFMFNIRGYAEAWRDGRITIVDTMPMSKRWDLGSKPTKDRPWGDNRLESYAKRWGVLDPDNHEMHLGLEDTHIMLLAMRKHLQYLKETKAGPYNPDNNMAIYGVGGRHLGR